MSFACHGHQAQHDSNVISGHGSSALHRGRAELGEKEENKCESMRSTKMRTTVAMQAVNECTFQLLGGWRRRGGRMRWQAPLDARLHPYNQPTNPVSAINAREGEYHHHIKACQWYLRALTPRGDHSRLPCSGWARIFVSHLTSCAWMNRTP